MLGALLVNDAEMDTELLLDEVIDVYGLRFFADGTITLEPMASRAAGSVFIAECFCEIDPCDIRDRR